MLANQELFSARMRQSNCEVTLRACLKSRSERGDSLGGVRPSSCAATSVKRLGWTFRVSLKCARGCARGRAHSDTGLFKQALTRETRRFRGACRRKSEVRVYAARRCHVVYRTEATRKTRRFTRQKCASLRPSKQVQKALPREVRPVMLPARPRSVSASD